VSFFTRRKSKIIDDIDARLSRASSEASYADKRDQMLAVLIGLAEVQSETMVAIAAERLGESDMARDSLSSAAKKFQDVLSELTTLQEASKADLRRRKAELEDIEGQINGQR
jgi:F0F1-type ATP synthase epsilon subunit